MSRAEDNRTVAIARLLERTTAEGPGVRTAVWTQGCSIRCVGCFNPELWSSDGGRQMSTRDVAEVVLSSGSDGVTFLGGEPFDQAEALSAIAETVQRAGLSVMTFTGYTFADLERMAAGGTKGVRELLAATDLLVDGPFEITQIDGFRPWVGSTNQGIHALTERYAKVAARPEAVSDRVEITVSADGETRVNGWATVDALERLLGDISDRPPALRVRRTT